MLIFDVVEKLKSLCSVPAVKEALKYPLTRCVCGRPTGSGMFCIDFCAFCCHNSMICTIYVRYIYIGTNVHESHDCQYPGDIWDREIMEGARPEDTFYLSWCNDSTTARTSTGEPITPCMGNIITFCFFFDMFCYISCMFCI